MLAACQWFQIFHSHIRVARGSGRLVQITIQGEGNPVLSITRLFLKAFD